MISNFLTKIRQGLSDGNGKTKSAFDFGRTVLLTSVVVTALLGGARSIGMLEGLELGAYDQMLRSRPNEGPDDRLLVVGISENDLKSINEYPISDGTLAQALEKLEQNEPRAIGIDILRDIPQGKGREALMEQMKSDRLIAVCKLSSESDNGVSAAPGVPQERVGFADFPLDPGGTLRRSLLISTPVAPKIPVDKPHLCNYADPENQVQSFSLQLAMLYLQSQGIEPELTQSGEIKLGSAVLNRIGKNVGGYHNTDAENDYQMLLNYRSVDNPAKQVTLTEVLEGKIDPALVKDRVVLIGYTAQSVKDYFVTPYSGGLRDNQTMPGVVAHAQNVSQILSAAMNNRPLIWYWPDEYELLWLLGWSLVGGTLAWGIRKPLFLVLAMGGGVVVLIGTCYVLFTHSGWIPVWPPLLGLVATAGAIVLLDRGAAKAIYAGVKKVLKLNIEIDESKKQAEVAEITESDFFKDLQQKANEIRSRDSKGASDSNSTTQKAPQTREESEAAEIDYFEQLQQKARQTREQRSDSENNKVSDSLGAIAPPQERGQSESAEIDYFERLQQKARQTREQHSDPESKTVSDSTGGAIAPPQDRGESESAQDLDYFERLQQKARQTREQHSDPENKTLSEEAIALPENRVESQAPQLDYFGQFQQKAHQTREEHSDGQTETVSQPQDRLEPEPSEIDFLQRLQQKASQAKLEYSEAPTEIVLDPTEPTTAEDEPMGDFDFLQRLQQKASQAKLEYSEAPTEIVLDPTESTTASSDESPESQPLGDFDFLQRLQQKSSHPKPQYSDALTNIISSTDEATTLPDERTDSEDVAEISFLQRLQQKAREVREQSSSEVPSDIISESTEPTAGSDEAPSKSESTQTTDYFEQFQQKARQMKNKDDGNNT